MCQNSIGSNLSPLVTPTIDFLINLSIGVISSESMLLASSAGSISCSLFAPFCSRFVRILFATISICIL